MKLGDQVQALDDDFEGVVVLIENGEVSVEDVDGFISYFRESELIPAVSKSMRAALSVVPDAVISEKEEAKRKKVIKVNPKERNAPMFEVDLHIHKLVDRQRGMSNYEILTIQLDTASRQLEFAIKKRISKMVFIHGVGEGVLREELYTLLRRYDNLRFYDADFQKYGAGATEVYIYQNVATN
ncbi:Smr domain-containing protein [Dokdonia sp. Hel_I_63]|uniref:Smr/MutS family protein n=1 Tax=unclassified Dokdonia TaxID=2615033 RepID=UPI00020A6868|nr:MULTISPECIES: Smr/MutS family protein [unclassified Dokdonia]AEE20107.1 hypothetical protein Krodi_2125 [Dokdonia sp. 4H-3-7-5]TVZ23639.1 Smr domain-containing protein [Dokdonia sp. Hel_I_63]